MPTSVVNASTVDLSALSTNAVLAASATALAAFAVFSTSPTFVVRSFTVALSALSANPAFAAFAVLSTSPTFVVNVSTDAFVAKPLITTASSAFSVPSPSTFVNVTVPSSPTVYVPCFT